MSTNLHIKGRAVPVFWGTYSIVEADFACLADLLAVPGWKYALNLAGSETMLATNRYLLCFFFCYISPQGAGDGTEVSTDVNHICSQSADA